MIKLEIRGVVRGEDCLAENRLSRSTPLFFHVPLDLAQQRIPILGPEPLELDHC